MLLLVDLPFIPLDIDMARNPRENIFFYLLKLPDILLKVFFNPWVLLNLYGSLLSILKASQKI